MRTSRLLSSGVALAAVIAIGSAFARQQDETTVIRASTVLDGAGARLTDVDITVRGGKITAITKATAKAPAGKLIDLQIGRAHV